MAKLNLKTLKPGDTFELGKLFPGLTDESIVWAVHTVTTTAVVVWGTWHGAGLGRYKMHEDPKTGIIISRIR